MIFLQRDVRKDEIYDDSNLHFCTEKLQILEIGELKVKFSQLFYWFRAKCLPTCSR